MTENRHNFAFAEDFTKYANIKVVGVGGAGGNAINRMIRAELKGVEFIAINTDAQVLDQNLATKKVQIGKELTNGLGAGANAEVGKRAVEETSNDVISAMGVPDLVFITAGMGGGTGTGAAPAIAQLAKAAGALTVAIVTTPFRFEGAQRSRRAEAGLETLRKEVDTLITIPNERLLQIVDRKTTLTDAFKTADEVLYQATRGISDLITVPGLINCDFADVRTVMLEMGDALMGTGMGIGDDKAIDSARDAISSPLLGDVSITGAGGVLINVTGGEDMTLFDVNTATSQIYEAAGEEANIIFGAVIDPEMEGQMRVTVIATGLGSKERRARKEAAVIARTDPGTPISLFPETPQPQKPQPQAQSDLDRPRPAVQPTPQPQYETEPMVQSEESRSVNHEENLEPVGTGNGNGNGNGHGRSRIPLFSESDRSTIPAYIRRLGDSDQ